MQEKRKSIRIEKPLMVKYALDCAGENDWNVAFIKNISEAGILFDTNRQFPAGENILIMLKIPLDPDNWIEAKGVVIDSRHFMSNFFLTRLKFTTLNDAQRALIKDYVAWFLSTQAPVKHIASENDKRKATRIYKNLMVSYGVRNNLGVVEKWDITTVKNFSKTGMVFTSSYICKDMVDFMIRLPSHPYEPLHINGRVIESGALKSSSSGSIEGTFLTRVEFINLKKEHSDLLNDFIDWLIKNDPDRPKKEDE